MNSMILDSLIYIPKSNPDAKMQLFCFPYAGGGIGAFYDWHKKLSRDIEVCIISYPGRGVRIKEDPIFDIEIMLNKLSIAFQQHVYKPYAIFGHSMGGVLSYGLVEKLEKSKLIPEHLFVSAAPAPTRLIHKDSALSTLPDDEFIKTLVNQYNAIPDIVLKDKDLMALFIPMIRADISLEEQYVMQYKLEECAPITCKITAFGGYQDSMVSESTLEAWKDLTKGVFTKKMFPGTHFYLNECPDLLFKEMYHILQCAPGMV